MLRHENCGGELRRTKRLPLYVCVVCGWKLYVGDGEVRQSRYRIVEGEGVRTYYCIPYAETDNDMSLHSVISNGGKVLVVGGTMNPSWASFEKHPQVVFWCGDQAEIKRHLKGEYNLPNNTKAVIISRYISHSESQKIMEEARRKRALIIAPLNDGEVTRKLEEIVTPPPPVIEPPKPKPMHTTPPTKPWEGTLSQFVAQHHHAEGIIAHEGQRLFEEAQRAGLKTTVASCRQAVGILRKKLGIAIGERAQKHQAMRQADHHADRPADADSIQAAAPKHTSTPTPPAEDAELALLKLLDDSIAGLHLVREEVVKFKQRSNDYLRLKAKLAALLNE